MVRSSCPPLSSCDSASSSHAIRLIVGTPDGFNLGFSEFLSSLPFPSEPYLTLTILRCISVTFRSKSITPTCSTYSPSSRETWTVRTIMSNWRNRLHRMAKIIPNDFGGMLTWKLVSHLSPLQTVQSKWETNEVMLGRLLPIDVGMGESVRWGEDLC